MDTEIEKIEKMFIEERPKPLRTIEKYVLKEYLRSLYEQKVS